MCCSKPLTIDCWIPQTLLPPALFRFNISGPLSRPLYLSGTFPSVDIMANPLNVYRGPDSVRSYFDPDSSPPLPLVEIPDCLNPYRQDGVRIYAKMMSMHPANNVKSMPGELSRASVPRSR